MGPMFARGCCGEHGLTSNGITRRRFVQVTGAGALGTVALSGLSWTAIVSEQKDDKFPNQRQPLLVKPILTYEVPQRREKTSWRSWGGIQTEQDAGEEKIRIEEELKAIAFGADFPVSFMPVSKVRSNQDLITITDLESADLFIVYAAGGSMNIFDTLNKMGKNIIIFCRHKSGPVYLWYEIISPRYLRQHTDNLAVKGIDEADVVIDSQDDLMWRLRALCGLKNTLDSTILAIGGPGAWAQPEGVVPALVRDKYRLDIRTITYEELGIGVAALREQLEVARSLGLVEVKPRTGMRRKPYSFAPAVMQSLDYAIALNKDHFLAFADPLREAQGPRLGVVFGFFDISRQKRIEADLDASNAELDAKNSQLRGYLAVAEELEEQRERRRVAEEIHRTLGTKIADLHAAMGEGGGAGPRALEDLLAGCRGVIGDIRSTVRSLDPGRDRGGAPT